MEKVEQFRLIVRGKDVSGWRFDLKGLNEEACAMGHAEYCDQYRAYFWSIFARIERRKVPRDAVIVKLPPVERAA